MGRVHGFLIILLLLGVFVGVYLASIREYHVIPFISASVARNSTITINPNSSWTYIYIWLNMNETDIEEAIKMFRLLNLSETQIQHYISALTERVPTTLSDRTVFIEFMPGEPKERVIGFNITSVKPRNGRVYIEVKTSYNESYRYEIIGFEVPKHIYIPLTQSGIYFFKIVNNGDKELTISLRFIVSHLHVKRPYLQYGLGIIGLTIIPLSILIIIVLRRKG